MLISPFLRKGKNAFNALRIYLDVVDKIPKNPTNPFIYGNGKVTAGEVRNAVPSYAKAEGSIRSLSAKKSKEFFDRLKKVIKSIKLATGVGI